MAKTKHSNKPKPTHKARETTNPWHKHKPTKAELAEAALLCQLPFIRDTRGEISHEDAGLYWWSVSGPDYWHQGLEVGKAFANRIAYVLPQGPERVEQALYRSLMEIVRKGYLGGVEEGFLQQIAHYAIKGMGANHG